MLKYLRDFGPANGVTLEMENSYGLTPIVYAMMNQQVLTFIYLYFKLKCTLPVERASWATMQLIKQGSSNTKIIQLLLHDATLGDKVAETALTAAVEHLNLDVLKTVLKHQFHAKKLTQVHV